ncbi:hypothetical protein [Pseudomonas farris]
MSLLQPKDETEDARTRHKAVRTCPLGAWDHGDYWLPIHLTSLQELAPFYVYPANGAMVLSPIAMLQWQTDTGVQFMGVMERALASSPFLASAAIPRTGDDEIPGYYSTELDMWVVNTTDGIAPVIAEGALSELMTKTKVNLEQDDEAPWQLDLLTKTFHNTESDDNHTGGSNELLQLVTKTDTTQERDDRCGVNHILELITKTNVELEHDDNGDPTFGLDTRYYEG